MGDTQNQAAISDDQELAKVLQGMQQQTRTMVTHDPQAPAADKPDAGAAGANMQYEEMPTPGAKDAAAPAQPAPAAPAPAVEMPAPVPENKSAAPTPEPAPVAAPALPVRHPVSPALESLKKEALEELRPLVTKLDLPAKEKFDTMLLIIRSTDDQDLLQPAHEAAKAIEDDTERAEALLDIVKEIDYFATKQSQK